MSDPALAQRKVDSLFRRAATLITASSVIHILGFVIALPGHIGDPTWSAHAQFHLVLSTVWVFGLNCLVIILTWIPLRQRLAWSFWAILLGFAVAQVGFFLAVLVAFEGRPMEPSFHLALGINLLMGAVGVGIARMVVKRG